MPEAGLTSRFAPVDPENFFAAQRRHRRVARVLAGMSVVAAALQSVLAAAITAPFTFVLSTVVLDLLHRFDVWADAPDLYEILTRSGAAEQRQLFAALIGIGLTVQLVLYLLIRRSLRGGLAGAALRAGSRAPDPSDAEEHQLTNIVEEMAIAAGIRPPAVLMVDGPQARGANIATFGGSRHRAALIVPVELLAQLDRQRTTALVAHQIASIANGDLMIFNSVQALPLTWAVPARAMSRPFRRSTWWMFFMLARMFVTGLRPDQEVRLIEELLTRGEKDVDADNEKGGLRGFVGMCVWLSWSSMRMLADFLVVGPLLTFWVRRRRYLADAMAVQLTRVPAELAGALVDLVAAGGVMPGAGSVDMACVVRPSTPIERESLIARRRRELAAAREAQRAGGPVEPADGWRARVRENQRLNRAASEQATADPERSPLGLLGENWHPATERRLRRLEAMGWLATDPELARAEAVLTEAEPSHRWYQRRTAADAPLLLRIAGTLALIPLFALVGVLLLMIAVLMLFLCIWPILWFYALPLYFVVLPLHQLLRS